jgi:hypothetical protein
MSIGSSPVIKSQRPVVPLKRNKTIQYRVNKLFAGIFNTFHRKGLNYHALDADASFQMLLQTGKSLIRFGNGESEIMAGSGMGTQEYHKDLRDELMEVIQNYSPSSNYLLALTNWQLRKSVDELKATPGKKAYYIWRFMRYLYWKLDMNKINMPFLEADMFRTGPVGLSKEYIKKLWADRSNIIIVYNNEEKVELFKKEHADKRIFFIRIPDKNFFFTLSKTQNEIIDLIKEYNLDRNDLVVLVAGGPGANILCYNLCQKDDKILCYDMGNFFHMHYFDI